MLYCTDYNYSLLSAGQVSEKGMGKLFAKPFDVPSRTACRYAGREGLLFWTLPQSGKITHIPNGPQLAQPLHHLMEDVGGDETIAQDFLSPLCPHGVHLFASSPWLVNMGCCVEAIVITICYGM